MGASTWYYFVPYQEDIEQALQDLRQEVFDSGDFYDWRANRIERLQQVSPEEAARLLRIEQQNPWRTDPVHNVEEWIAQMQMERSTLETMYRNEVGLGTHTIIDITRLIEKIEVGGAVDPLPSALDEIGMALVPPELENGEMAPFPPAILLQILGTTQPDHALCLMHLDELIDVYPGWNGGYTLIYEQDQPTEILFCGRSGL